MQYVQSFGTPALALLLISFSATSHASLTSFEQSQGYKPFLDAVQNYNAGQYGPGSGYPSSNVYTPIAANSGQWKIDPATGGGNGSYATGHQFFDRTEVNAGIFNGAKQGLVLTTSHLGWSGPALKYTYDLDAQDLGVNPLSTGSSSIKLSFWWCSQLPGSEIGGMVPNGYFGDEISFMDSAGNVGFRLGLTQRMSGDHVTYWDGTSLNESSIVAASHAFDRWDITLDVDNDVFSADYYSFGSNTLHSLVSNAPMIAGMTDFTRLGFRTSPGVNNAKLLALDDFSFTVVSVPEPGTITLAICALLALGRSRRRSIVRE